LAHSASFISATAMELLCRRPRGAFWIARSVRLPVPWRSCLGYRHAGCLQLSHRRPSEMYGLRTRPRMDLDPPQFLDRTAIVRRHIDSPHPGRCFVYIVTPCWETQSTPQNKIFLARLFRTPSLDALGGNLPSPASDATVSMSHISRTHHRRLFTPAAN